MHKVGTALGEEWSSDRSGYRVPCMRMKPSGDLFSYRLRSPATTPRQLRATAGVPHPLPVWNGCVFVRVFVESQQQAVAGALSASFTGGTGLSSWPRLWVYAPEQNIKQCTTG